MTSTVMEVSVHMRDVLRALFDEAWPMMEHRMRVRTTARKTRGKAARRRRHLARARR